MKTKRSVLPFFTQFNFLVLSLFVAFLIFSCSDIASGYVFEKSAPAKYLYISLESNSGIVRSSGSRTLTASAVDFTDESKDYQFYIWGQSTVTKGKLTPRKVDFNVETGTTGTIELNFAVSNYNFVLAVTQGEPQDISEGSEVLKEAIFVGYSNVDLTYTNNVKFYLSDTGLSAYGSVDLDLYLDESWSDEQVTDLNEHYYVTYGLYYIKSGLLPDNYAAQHIEGLLSKTIPCSTSEYYSAITAGTYNFTINIKKIGTEKTYSYSDRIIVAANRSVKSSVYIPNIIERVPVAPQEFKAAYTMDSRIYYEYDSDLGTSTRYTSSVNIDEKNVQGYGLLLKWTDDSNNETHFKITLANLTKIYNSVGLAKNAIANIPSTGMADSTWNSIVGTYENSSAYSTIFTKDTYMNKSEYIGGSIERNSTQLILYVPFENCYIAKIQAVNDAGESSACYLSFDLGDEEFSVTNEKDIVNGNSVTYTGSPFTVGSDYSKIINLYKIVYYLCGGTIVYRNDGGSHKSPDYIIEYHTYGDGSFFYPTSTVASSTPKSPALVYWRNGITDDDGNVISSTPTHGSLWNRWKVDSYYGTDLIEIVGGDTDYSETDLPYQKPNAYTGYTSLYLFARYDSD